MRSLPYHMVTCALGGDMKASPASEITALVIDDSAGMRQAMRDILQSVPGCSIVAEGANGLEALQLALAFHPDLIVLDINMPLMGGLEALRVLKGEMIHTYIIMVSTVLAPDVRDRALRLGADGCLEKSPQLWSELRALVTHLSQAKPERPAGNRAT